ncbi:MAG: FlgD immunoglobulin-like domain containing protein [bacterium]
MHLRHVCSQLLFFLLLTVDPALAKENPIKPKMYTSEHAKKSLSITSEFICGTYKGNEVEIVKSTYAYQAAIQKRTKESLLLPAKDSVFDDVLVMEDDGTVLIQGINPFDTDLQTFHFTPNANNGYDVSAIPFTFDAALGGNLQLGDDTNTTRNLRFPFSFYDIEWNDIHISANGIVTFGADVNPSGFFDDNDFFNNLPKIALYFMDLNPAARGGVFLKSAADNLTITWNNITEFADNNGVINSNTIQLVLHKDNSFDITFNGIEAKTQVNNAPIAFGIHPGGLQPNFEFISYSDDLPFSGGAGAGILETYLNIQQPIVNDVAMMRRFYQSFPDSFFQTIFFTNFSQTMAGFANEFNIKNRISGIGIGLFDASDNYGSNGVLESRCNMNQLGVWPNNPAQRFFGGGNNFLTILGQEAGHRWGAFVNFVDANGQVSNLILGRADAHWSFYVDVDHSSLEGGNWEPVSGDLFRTPTQIDFFGDIDEYIFGVRLPEEVKSTFYISSPTNNLPQNRDNGTPVQGATARGIPVEVTIEDIIAAEGTRLPLEPDAPKDLRQAFIFILQNGTSPGPGELDKITNFRKTWEDYFERSVDGRMTLNTSITQTFPIAVLRGHVIDAVTQRPIRTITVRSVERTFEQFVPAGGRYTFRYMADQVSGSAEDVTVIASAPGYLADTLATSLEYGSEQKIDIALKPNTTSVENGLLEAPSVFLLEQNYPNPFNPATTIRYSLSAATRVSVTITNIKGQKIATLVQEKQNPGTYSVTWNGKNSTGERVASGIYLVQLKTGEFVQSQKMLLVR